MTELSPKARALLARTSRGVEPSVSDRDRVRTALYARVAAAAAAGAALSTPAAATSGHVVRRVLTKLGLGTPLAKLLGSLVALSTLALTLTLVRKTPVPEAPREATPSPVVSALAPLAPAPPASLVEEGPHVPLVDVTSLPSAQPKTSRTPRAMSPTLEPGSLEDEIALLREAQGAARGHDDTRALTLLDTHARRFPNGVLAEEREAARIFALCSLGRVDEAGKARAAFLAAHPGSPHTSRVREACPGE